MSSSEPDESEPRLNLDGAVITAFDRLGKYMHFSVYTLGAMGVLLICKSAFIFIPKDILCLDLAKEWKNPLYVALSGIEFLLMSPLAFLVVRSLYWYLDEIRRATKSRRRAFSKNNQSNSDMKQVLAQGFGAPEASKDIVGNSAQVVDDDSIFPHNRHEETFLSPGKEGLLETKALVVALLVSIVAVHLIGRLTTESGGEEMPLIESITSLTLLSILAAIYFCIELLGASLRRKSLDMVRSNQSSI